MDDMFFRNDGKSLKRGKRRDRRTPTCRPCLLWVLSEDGEPYRGVVLDVNGHGMCVRMLDELEPGLEVRVQLMHDEDFREPMADPMMGRVARRVSSVDGFYDHGVSLERQNIRREESRPVEIPKRPTGPARAKPRMHTLDLTVSDRWIGRTRR